MASAAAILLLLTLNAWLGLWGPIWNAAWKMQPGDALGVVVAVVGWIVTIAVGIKAFSLAQRQIKLGREQIALQQHQIEMQQQQIAETREELRKSNHARLVREFQRFAWDIDRLITAKGYLGTFTARFPEGRLDGWSVALVHARSDASDSLSQSAVAAPLRYGERISTLVNRVQRLGDMLTQASPGMMPTRGILDYYESHVRGAIEGIRQIENQITADIPNLQEQLLKLADERDTYAKQ